jgi:ABC-2 type transport system permease protein
MNGFLRRMKALVNKEFLQLSRDSSSLLLGIILPIALILIIGYGISLDIKNISTAVVLEDPSPKAQDAVSFLNGSAYFSPTYVTSLKEAEAMLLNRDASVIIDIPPDFTSTLAEGRAKILVALDGVETATAMTTQGYIESALSSWLLRQPGMDSGARITIESRMWYNDANSSTWFFLPGLIMLIVTIVGIMLTAIVMAREWERGTFESLFVTPVRPMELVLAKIIPYFCVALLGVFICLFLSRFLFEVPLMGSLAAVIILSMIYLMVALGIGLVISEITKNQFLACQTSMLISFLPCVVLSGFIFDLRSTPVAVQVVGKVLPFSHYLTCIRSIFLSGNNWSILLKEGGLLCLYGIFFIVGAFAMTRKKVE